MEKKQKVVAKGSFSPASSKKAVAAKKPLPSEKPVQDKKEKKHAKKGKALVKIRRLIARKRLPVFRGRFGKKQFRRKSIEKWQKWRKPRGKDVHKKQEDGARPKAGYRTAGEIRFLHPSGYRERLVHNVREVSGLKDCIVRIAASVGKKKRKQIIAEAKKIGLRTAN